MQRRQFLQAIPAPILAIACLPAAATTATASTTAVAGPATVTSLSLANREALNKALAQTLPPPPSLINQRLFEIQRSIEKLCEMLKINLSQAKRGRDFAFETQTLLVKRETYVQEFFTYELGAGPISGIRADSRIFDEVQEMQPDMMSGLLELTAHRKDACLNDAHDPV